MTRTANPMASLTSDAPQSAHWCSSTLSSLTFLLHVASRTPPTPPPITLSSPPTSRATPLLAPFFPPTSKAQRVPGPRLQTLPRASPPAMPLGTADLQAKSLPWSHASLWSFPVTLTSNRSFSQTHQHIHLRGLTPAAPPRKPTAVSLVTVFTASPPPAQDAELLRAGSAFVHWSVPSAHSSP